MDEESAHSHSQVLVVAVQKPDTGARLQKLPPAGRLGRRKVREETGRGRIVLGYRTSSPMLGARSAGKRPVGWAPAVRNSVLPHALLHGFYGGGVRSLGTLGGEGGGSLPLYFPVFPFVEYVFPWRALPLLGQAWAEGKGGSLQRAACRLIEGGAGGGQETDS